MAEREVIREFLTKLGFTVDEPSFRKFIQRMATTDKAASNLDASVLGIVAAVETMVTVFSVGMERMYYQSRRTGSTVQNLTALSFGFGQIGLRAEDAQSAVESLAAATRNNPGLNAMLAKLIGSSEKDPAKQLVALVQALKQMPYFVGSQFANLFGIPENVFRMLTLPGALEKLNVAQDRSRDIYRSLGVDQEAAAAASMKYMNSLRELWMRVNALGDVFVLKFQGPLNAVNQAVSDHIDRLAHVDYDSLKFDLPTITGFLYEQAGGWRGLAKGIAAATEEATKFAMGADTSDRMWRGYGHIMALMMGGPNYANGGRDEGGLFPPGTPGYDAARRTMAGEGFPKPTAPNAPARGRRFAGEFLGDTDEEALNIVRYWAQQGMTSTARVKSFNRPALPPAETGGAAAGAARGPANLTVNQNNHFSVTGGDPRATAEAVAATQGRASRDLGDVIRNSAGAIQ